MKKIVSVIVIFSVIVSCQEINRTPKPDDLIPENKMVDVLTEISLLHGARSYNKALMEEKGINPYPYLMEKFGIDSVQLVRSNNYYAENYKQYQRIYDKVKVRLETLMQKYDSIREVEEKRQDSIRKLIKSDTLNKRQVDSLLQDTILINLPQPVSRKRERKVFQDTVR
ncbi:DUF4296 domain-containing protein [Salinimicrobium xinjiangense]|uniref:DUF4296 domain-containing protein n=1 Tax=Salinimicrobium xinjiangense TaxID=438596 RepID=UPI000685C940|nr:DUF4296 domain-containing protein [Salinimicrobium xinjiangense]